MTTAPTISTITIDAADALASAAFWSQLLGQPIDDGASAEYAVVSGGALPLAFVAVPESKAVKNRVHLDLRVAALPDAVAAATSLGAKVLGEFDGWTVLADPFGNEFCLVG